MGIVGSRWTRARAARRGAGDVPEEDGAAGQVGVSESTVYRRLGEPAFRQEVTNARAAMVERASARLTALGEHAVVVLGHLLTDPRPTIRLAAAKHVLDLGARWREVLELEERVAGLEKQLANLENVREDGAQWQPR